MKIIYHHRILARDGMRVHIDQLVGALRDRDHSVTVVGPEGGAGQASRSGLTGALAGLRTGLPKWIAELMEVGYDYKALAALESAVRREQPDVLYERYNAFLTAGLKLKRRHGLPLLIEVNAPLADERAAEGNLALARLARRMERAVWQGADAVLPVSHSLAGMLRATGVPDERITVIPNGVDLSLFPETRDFRVKRELGLQDRIVFGFVGYVRPWHGLDRVLSVFARRADPRLHLLIVGEGPASEGLRRMAAELGLSDRLTFTGTKPHSEIPRLLQAVDVALQPDATAYASPLKLFEYMAAGCAVIAPDQPNIREILQDGETAMLFDSGAENALETVIARLADDDGLRAHLGGAARREIVEKDYSWSGNARRVETIADRLRERIGGR